MAYLVLVRHGQSEWNATGLWTGWTDIHLSEKGRQEARNVGTALRDLRFDKAYTSTLIRTKETLHEIEQTLDINLPTIDNKALNERNYGDYTGKNKWEIEKKIGETKFNAIRRGFDVPVPNGETLKDVYERIVPYYDQEIKPQLAAGKNILIVAHGNSLRALVKYLDNISDTAIAELNIPTGGVYVYTIDKNGTVTHKEVRQAAKVA